MVFAKKRLVVSLVAASLVVTTCTSGDTGVASETTAAESSPAAPQVSAPDELGPYAIGRRSIPLTDESRGRTLLVDILYPVEPGTTGELSRYVLFGDLGADSEHALADVAVADGEFPLVLFSHGNTGVRFQSIFYTEALASHGFVVVAPDHTGNTITDSSRTVEAAADRPADISFLIDAIETMNADADDALFGHIDLDRIGVTGHSYGGYTSLAMASGVGDAIAPDDRVTAIVPIAPAATLIKEANLERAEVPALVIGGTDDVTTPIEDSTAYSFDNLGSEPLYRVDLIDAAHWSFTIVCEVDELVPELPPEIIEIIGSGFEEGCAEDQMPVDEAHRLTNRYAISFFLVELAGDSRYQQFLTASEGVEFYEA
ncbi:MAG: hypothetical protein JJLCMIEE_00770 [Acidimicrobiales bacterium]|nr:MAG: alpha/beta fold hydrolase [Actinomycetota bacterium]MBV6507715.1 hypothetical protein [Acidimicrobiales bacterium]RIK07639.1 MAG: hypothetical protein DCC48_03870 [Acidobacteriota bacterium]